MKKLLLLFVLLTGLAVDLYGQTVSETYFRFPAPERLILDKLAQVISLDNVKDGYVYAYANPKELAAFEIFGLVWEPLPHPGTLISPRMSRTPAALADWNSYPTYSAYVATMYQFQTDYPDLCEIVDIGTTVEGRAILFARISDNIGVEEDEPEVMHTRSMHGDETTGYILCLRLIDSLLSAYGSDSHITRLVDSLEIWINPLANPDGTYHGGNNSVYGATRYNANSVDLNRNFADPATGDHPDGNGWQPETIAMMNLASAHSFIISANFHGGEEVVNYPWDTWARLPADVSWYLSICHAYADTVHEYSPSGYMDGFSDGVTNGYTWYRVTGGRQDFMNYWQGCREITIEISDTKLLAASQLPALWTYNRASLLQHLEQALFGVRGLVTDNQSGLPVAAVVRVLGHDVDNSQVFTDPEVGDYHRMLAAGTYDFEFSSPGYYPDTVAAVAVVDRQSVRVDVALEPLPFAPILALDATTLNIVDPGDNVSFRIVLRNDGAGNAVNTFASLSTSDPYISVTTATSGFPTVPALGGTAQSSVEYAFEIAPTCPRNHPVDFSVAVTTDGAESLESTVSFVVGPLIEDYETANFSRFPWQTSGDRLWEISIGDAAFGTYGAVSGVITHSQYSELSLDCDVAAAGVISFRYKVSTEAGYDELTFAVDGSPLGVWSGSVAWTPVTFEIAAGTHTLTWRYAKDELQSTGQDRVRIDRIVFPALVSAVSVSTTNLPAWTVGQSYSQTLIANGSLGDVVWSDLDNELNGSGLSLAANGQISGAPTTAGLLTFSAAVDDEAGGHSEQVLKLLINAAPLIEAVNPPHGSREEPYLYQLGASGGTPPLVWSDPSGQLSVVGLAVQTDGAVMGTPAISGHVTFTARVEDAAGAFDEAILSLDISTGCCVGTVGDANQSGGAEPTIGDISALVDLLFLTNTPPPCLEEADANQSGGVCPTLEDITIGDISALVDYLFLSGTPLADCL